MTTQQRTPKTVAASAVIGLVIALLLVGGSIIASAPSLSGDETADSTVSQDVARIDVTDSIGRVVSIPEDPQRIAALDAFSGDVCVLVGAGDKLIGAPGGVLSNRLLAELCPDLPSKEQLSGSGVNVEELLAAGTDVALIRRSLYEGEGEVAKLDKLGIPYVVVDYDTVEEQMAAIGLVGSVCGPDASQRSLQIMECYQDVLDIVDERSAQIADRDRKSVFHSINDPLLTDGSTSLGADWIERCGALDVSAGEEGGGAQGDYTATLEQVYAWKPDYVICNTAQTAEEFKTDVRWSGLSAVKKDQVYNMPVSTSRWGQRGDPEVFLGMLWLGETIYPELYSDIDIKDFTISYYKDVIGLDIDDALWENILSGVGLRQEGGSGSGSDEI